MEPTPKTSSLSQILRRRNFFTHKKLQFRFALISSALIFFSTIGAWILLYVIIQTSIRGNWAGTEGGIDILHRTNLIVCGVVLADAIAVFLISISFSHSVAGPLYRIERSLEELLENGHTRKIALRKYDMLKETADLVNQVIERFGRK